MRRLVADRIAYDYVGGLRDISHKYGLQTWLENYGHWGFPGEFLQYGGQSDELVVNSGVLVSWAILRTGLLPLVGIFMGRIRYLLSLLQVVGVRLNAIPLR